MSGPHAMPDRDSRDTDLLVPAYVVRRSTRARRVRLTVTARDGLVVTLPAHAPDALAERAVRERAAWAYRALADVAERRDAYLADPARRLPEAVDLRSIGRTLPVRYDDSPSRAGGSAIARERAGVLAGAGAGDPEARLAALRRWRDRTAREVLPALLHEASERTSIAPERVTVRGQRTRWGSCSARGTVSLNRNLLFLPPHLVEYVISHELAHVRVPDHSARFWALLEVLVPSPQEARAELRAARHLVPVWADE